MLAGSGKRMAESRNLYGQKIITSIETIGAFKRHGGFDVPALRFIQYIGEQTPGIIGVDIGANIGNHTVVMGRFFSKVIAFEPRLAVENFLKINVEQNQLSNVMLVPMGLSDSAGRLELFLDRSGNGGNTTFVKSNAVDSEDSVEVDVGVGDDFLARANIGDIGFVKLDVEGLEAKVLLGLEKTIANSKPIVVMEWNNEQTKHSFVRLNIFEKFFSDYVLVGIREPYARELFSRGVLGWLKRKWSKLVNRDGFQLVEFSSSQSYENLLLMPKEKIVSYPHIAKLLSEIG